MNPNHKPVAWLGGEIKTPPMSTEARLKAGFYVRMLQAGELLSMPESRPMPSIGPGCHELRISDKDSTWRVIYRIDPEAILVLEVFQKKTQQTPKSVIDVCKKRLSQYDSDR
jgi:phage-related protein